MSNETMEKKEVEDLKDLIREVVMAKEGISSEDKEAMIVMLEKRVIEGESLAPLIGLDENAIEYLYDRGTLFYKSGKYDEAKKLFRVLMVLSNGDFRFVMGLAACYQMSKEYIQAIGWYIAITIYNQDSPYPWFYMSSCYEKIKEIPLAIDALEKTVELSGNKLEFKALKENAERTLDALRQKVKEKVKVTK